MDRYIHIYIYIYITLVFCYLVFTSICLIFFFFFSLTIVLINGKIYKIYNEETKRIGEMRLSGPKRSRPFFIFFYLTRFYTFFIHLVLLICFWSFGRKKLWSIFFFSIGYILVQQLIIDIKYQIHKVIILIEINKQKLLTDVVH